MFCEVYDGKSDLPFASAVRDMIERSAKRAPAMSLFRWVAANLAACARSSVG